MKSKRGQLRTKEEKQALINKVDLYRQDFKVREAVKKAGISYRTYFQYKKEIKNGTIDDGRLTSSITDKHIEYIGAYVCAWPHISLDSYLKVLNLIFPGELNRTKLYNFLEENRLSTKRERVIRTDIYKKGKKSLSSYYSFRHFDKSTEVDFRDEDIQRKLRKEKKTFFRDMIVDSLNPKEEDSSLNYRDLFKSH